MEKDHLEILLEDIKDKFNPVLEGHDALRQEIIDRTQKLDEKIEMNSFLIQGLNKKIDSVEERLNKKIDTVEEKLNNKIETVEERLDKKIDAVEKRLNNKMDNIEERLNNKINDVQEDLGKKLDAVANDLAAHRADTESHDSRYTVSE